MSYKNSICSKSLQLRFDKIDGFIRIYDRSKYLLLLDPEKCDAVYKKIKYLINIKSGITDVFSHYYENQR